MEKEDQEGQNTGNQGGNSVDDVDVRLLVHQSQAGCIIGKGGGKVKELREVRCVRSRYEQPVNGN